MVQEATRTATQELLNGFLGRAEDTAKSYLDQIGIVQTCLETMQARRQAVQEAKERLERARTEALLRETPLEKGAPGKINGGNAEIRALQAAQVLDEDVNYQTCKLALETCQRELDQAELEHQAAMLKLSALKALTKLYTAELAAIAELG